MVLAVRSLEFGIAGSLHSMLVSRLAGDCPQLVTHHCCPNSRQAK